MNYDQHILQQIKKLALVRKTEFSSDGKYAKIICVNPNHKNANENTPSLRVNLQKHDKFNVGSAKCWSCGQFYGSWNKLTEALFRPDLALNDQNDYEDPIKVSSFFAEKDEEDSDPDPIFHRDLLAGTPWVYNQEWRGINGQLLLDINARMYFDTQLEVPMLYLPCVVNKAEMGGIKAYIKPPKKGIKYINTKGGWVKSRGLFGFDQCKQSMKKLKKKTIVVVEGPRDQLNLAQNGIPTTAILGSNNFDATKAELLLSLNPKRIITCFDPDDAGDKAKRLVFKHLQGETNVVNFNLYKWEEKLGIKGLDPGNANQKVINAIEKHLI